jgi:hypothetical protein
VFVTAGHLNAGTDVNATCFNSPFANIDLRCRIKPRVFHVMKDETISTNSPLVSVIPSEESKEFDPLWLISIWRA